MHRPPRRRPQSLVTLVLSVALAGVLGTIVYFAVTSLPYLASSPTTDPRFGALNQCLLEALPQRVGFAAAADARRAAAWSTDTVAECVEAQPQPTRRSFALAGATVGAYDGAGRLWLAAASPDGGAAPIHVVDERGPRAFGDLAAQQLAGTPDGVVALEPSGQLVSVHADGSVSGLVQLPPLPDAQLSTSGDGQRVAVLARGGVWVFDARTLARVRAESPCLVDRLWWLPDGEDGGPARHRVLLRCAAEPPFGLRWDVESGEQEPADHLPAAPSTLLGPAGPWVQGCDVLPCTATPP